MCLIFHKPTFNHIKNLWDSSGGLIIIYTSKHTNKPFLWQTVWNWGLPDPWYECNGEFSGQADTRITLPNKITNLSMDINLGHWSS